MCHAGKNGGAGKYGDAMLGCDSPMELVQDTIKWVKENLGDKIDFIIWTGDNVRHDNDRRFPRTEVNIFDLNQEISDLMHENFGTLPIPSLGNNDVFPHNLFSPGPTLQTRELFKIWRPFVPQDQLHVFNRGAYFFHEVIPNHLAVLSINTLYLFQSNPLVDNCDGKKQPGYKLFEWLGNVLKEMRARKMKVWLTGHVPPNEKNYDISCLRKYVVWAHEYRDVIIGGLYGHMNIDHFIPLDSVQAYKSIKTKFAPLGFDQAHDFEEGAESEDEETDELDWTLEEAYAASNSPVFDDFPGSDSRPMQSLRYDDIRIEGGIPSRKVGFLDSVRKNLYAAIKGKKKAGKLSQRYAIAHVTASIVPTFNPGLRVWEYNITNLEEEINQSQLHMPWDAFFRSLDTLWDDEEEADYYDDDVSISDQMNIFKRDKTFPPKMPKDLSPGPAYIPQTFTPERYVQYYADLASINNSEKFSYEISYATDDKTYNMDTLTVDEWIKLGRRLGMPVKDEEDDGKKKKKGKKKEKELRQAEKLWEKFLKHSFIDSNYENLGYG